MTAGLENLGSHAVKEKQSKSCISVMRDNLRCISEEKIIYRRDI